MSYVNDWIWLHISCPVDGCPNNEITYWSHIRCPFSGKEHDIKLNSAGYLKCSACNASAPLIEWRFDCGIGHGLKHATNLFRLYEILGIMNRATNDQNFCARLMKSVGEMFLQYQ